MADRKPGPVKPPVIDLTARPADPATPAAQPAAAAAAPASPPEARPETKPEAAEKPARPTPDKPAPPHKATLAKPPEKPTEKPPEPPASPEPAARPSAAPRPASWRPAGIGVLGGAAIGIAVCYGLAVAGYWPSVPDSRVDALAQQLTEVDQTGTANGTALADLDARFRSLEGDFAAKLAAASAAVAKMQQEAGKAAPDLAPLADQLKTLSGRVDAVAAGASSADAGALAANLATIRQDLSRLGDKVAAVDGHLTHTDAAVTGLGTELATAKAAIDKAAAAPSSASIANAVRLPLLISALEADFAGGRGFADDLKRLTDAAPATPVPAALTAAAAGGLPAPAAFAASFEAKMPDLLAALPGSTDSSWQGRATDWLRGLLALRTQGEQTGDSPTAVLSRLEAAVLRHDFAGAAPLFGQLPAAVQDAAGPLGDALEALAAADTFVAALRQSALAPAGAAS